MKRWFCLLILVVLVPACTDAIPDSPLAPDGARFTQMASGPIVNSVADPGVGDCDATECTLREAIAFADSGATIVFDVVGTTIVLQAQLEIGKSLTIEGPGAGSLVVSGNRLVRVFDVAAGTAVRISGLTIRHGWAAEGGGIRSYSENLMLSHVLVTENYATSESVAPARGAGIANFGTLTVANSHVMTNQVRNFVDWGLAEGGGIYSGGTLAVTNSAVTGNAARASHIGLGGGILCAGPTTITNSTVSGNYTPAPFSMGGGIWRRTADPLTLVNSTVVRNHAIRGGGISIPGSFGGQVTLINTLVAGNEASQDHPDLSDPNDRVAAAHSLIGNGGGHKVTHGSEGNLVGVLWTQLHLGDLAANGGPTPTHALLPGSPALDVASSADCSATDQRGVLRPQGGGCDIGAFEARAYAFVGFLGPIANPPMLNEAKAGQAVPVKFSLSGNQGLGVLASGYPVATQFECDLFTGTTIVEGTATAGASGLSYDPLTDTYTYAWKTDKSWSSSCRRLTLTFADEAGTTRTAEFRFVK
jgi:CSLREA domain-containing protein